MNEELESVLKSVTPDRSAELLRQVNHFTNNEAEHRDEIVYGYFGREGVGTIARIISDRILSHMRQNDPRILDIGSGVGTFTVPILDYLEHRLSGIKFFAMDLTPSMLRILAGKTDRITPFVGNAEDIAESARIARKRVEIPEKFDSVVSVLMLHHIPDVWKVFRSISGVLEDGGIAVLVDMVEHPFAEWRQEMGDYHLGFKMGDIEKLAHIYFKEVKVEKLPAECECSESGRSASLFMSVMAAPKP